MSLILAFTLLAHVNVRTDLSIGTPVAIPCQAPGVIGSTLVLVGTVSVFCDWVR